MIIGESTGVAFMDCERDAAYRLKLAEGFFGEAEQDFNLSRWRSCARYFKMSPHFWLGLQMDYEVDMAEDTLEGRLEKEITPMSATG